MKMKTKTILTVSLLAFLLLSVMLRVVYYRQINAGPVIWQHQWQQSDMNYYDAWGREIAGGDLLSARISPPMHDWQIAFAEVYAQRHQGGEITSGSMSREQAQNLWHGWLGKGALYQEPLYSYFVAFFYKVCGDDHRNLLIFQQLIGVATLWLLYSVARKSFGRAVGLVTLLLATLYPMAIYYEMLLLRESLLLFFSVLLLSLAQRLPTHRNPGFPLLFGLVAGLAILGKSSLALLVFLLIAGMLIRARHGSGRSQSVVAPLFLILCGVAVAFLPLLYRNYSLGVPLLTFAKVGSFTFALHNVSAYPPFGGDVFTGEIYEMMADVMYRSKFNLLPTMLETVRTHDSWWSFFVFLWQKFLFLWHWYEIPNNDNFYYSRLQAPVLSFLPLSFGLLAPMAIVGMGMAAGHWRRHWHLYLLVATNIFLLVVFLNTSRLRMALGFSLLPFAAYALVKLSGMLKRRSYPRIVAIGLAVILLTLWTQRPLPGGNQPIRPGDYYVPLAIYYWPRMEASVAQGDAKAVAALCASALQVEPRHEIDSLIKGELTTVTSNDIDVATIFAEANEKCSRFSHKVENLEQSQKFKIRSSEIGQALNQLLNNRPQ